MINSVAPIWHFANILITNIEEIFKADKPIQSDIVLHAHPSSILPQKDYKELCVSIVVENTRWSDRSKMNTVDSEYSTIEQTITIIVLLY